MFRAMRHRWREARSETLRAEFEDAVMRMNGFAETTTARTMAVLAASYNDVNTRIGTIDNLSNAAKQDLAKLFIRRAKEKFKFRLGEAYGLALLGMFLEAQTLPGDDARFVEEHIQALIHLARSQINGSDAGEHTSEQERDALASEMIEIGKLLGVETPRETAEMFLGRPISDNEWEACRVVWERNWT